MSARSKLHDSGLRDGGLLARLLRAGIVVLDDAQRCCHASRLACELLGAADEAALRKDWESIRAQLALGALAGRSPEHPPLRRSADVRAGGTMRMLRIEVWTVPGTDPARHVALVRDRARVGPAERVQVMASEADANRHVLTGLVHEAKGPLNNFHLTLALLASSIVPLESSAVPRATVERWRRYLGVLQTECARLSDCLNDIHALTQPEDDEREYVDLCTVLRDVMRVLRHEATMREVTIELQVPVAGAATVIGNAHQLRLAMLGFTTSLLDAVHRGGILRLHVQSAEDGVTNCVTISGAPAALPAALVDALFSIGGADSADHSPSIAGRIIVEAHGGAVTVSDAGGSAFVIRIPRASG